MEPSYENEEALVLWLRRGIRMTVRVLGACRTSLVTH